MADSLDADESNSCDAPKEILEPVLKELIRTEVCPPHLRLLVDKIYITSHHELKRKEAYIVWLSDGQKAIQAVLKQELHPFVTTEEIHEGSFVLVTKYFLARAKKINERGNAVHLLINDLEAIGEDGRLYSKPSYQNVHSAQSPLRRLGKHNELDSFQKIDLDTSNFQRSGRGVGKAISADITADDDVVDLVQWYGEGVDETHLGLVDERCQDQLKKEKTQASSDPLQTISINLSPSPRPQKVSKPFQRQTAAEEKRQPEFRTQAQQNETSPLAKKSKALLPVTRPLHITPLSKLVGAKATRNETYDVFAVVFSVDSKIIQRKDNNPDVRQVRIMDMSTKKKVLLSVHVDAKNFAPPVGTIALFRSVTTHVWDGGSLNAYHSKCEGREWFVPNPVDIPGCNVNEMRNWWSKEVATKKDV